MLLRPITKPNAERAPIIAPQVSPWRTIPPESTVLALNDSLALFEKGVKLARFLREELVKAEKKINILLKDEKGEMKEESFELAEEEGELSESQDNPDSDDNNSLPF